MKKRYLLVGLLVLLLVVAVTTAACGGTTTTTTAPNTQTTTAPNTQTTTAPSSETTAPAGTQSTTASSTVTTAAATPATGTPIKIGFLTDATGPAAAVAASLGKGIELQIDYINSHGGIAGRPIEVTTLDCKSDTPTALANINKLIKDDKVSFVLGPFSPYEQEPCNEIADQTQTPLLNCGPATLAAIQAKTQHQWAFGFTSGPISQDKAIMQIIKDNGWKKLIGIGDVLGMDQDMLKYLKDNEAAGGYSINVLPDIVQLGATDFQPILNKLRTAYEADKPDAVLLITTMLASPSLYKGMRSLGMDAPVLTTPSADHPAVFAMGPQAVEGMMLIDEAGIANPAALPDSWPLKAGQLDFIDRYKAKYGAGADFFAAEGADMANTMIAAMQKAGGDDKAKVQQAMLQTTDLPGLTGIITFSPQLTAEGVQRPFTEWVIKNGGYELVKTFE